MKHQGVILFVLLFFAISCSKKDEDDNCTAPGAPVITSNSPVEIGDTIELLASTVPGATGYSCTGPGGFTSTSKNPVITLATGVNAGTYSVKAVSGSCMSEAATTTVTVDTLLPCAPFTNQVNFNGAAPVAVSFVSGALDNSLNQYKITANGASGDVHIYFGRTTQPTAGIYELKSSSSFLTESQAAITVTASLSFWQNSSGILYVSVPNGKVSASFCNIPFSESTFGFNTTAFGNIREQ